MALFVSCILTMHMMLYFFHHFELPFVLNTFQIRMRINNENVRISQNQAQSNRGASANEAHSGVGIVEEETADQLNDQNVNGKLKTENLLWSILLLHAVSITTLCFISYHMRHNQLVN